MTVRLFTIVSISLLFTFVALGKTINQMTTSELIPFWGYKYKNYTVQTDDGYVLILHRIPNENSAYPPVLIQHGLLLASDMWILRGPSEDFAFLLANEGFDVWLADTRGNFYSKGHKYLKYGEKRYWNFSWHEVGIYDIPAMVKIILQETGRLKVIHIGYSMGATAFYVMAAMKPEMNDKIHAHISLAPVAFMTHLKPLNIFTLFVELSRLHLEFPDFLRMDLFFQRNFGLHTLMSLICNSERRKKLCLRILFYFIGIDYTQVNKDFVFERFLSHFPSGASVKMMMHYAQNILTGDFRQFDYYDEINVLKYDQSVPPSYNLTNIQIPIYIYYCANDYVSHYVDVEKLVTKLHSLNRKYLVPYENFNHLDYVWAKDAKAYLYDDIINQLKSFNGK